MVMSKHRKHSGSPLGCERFNLRDGTTCVLIYTNSHCVFCPAARQMLEERLKIHELPVDSIHEVDCDLEDVSDITALPTIQVCGIVLTGLPEEDMLDRALWLLRLNPCYFENKLSQD
ncbi:MAG: glutaredoxin family protein [Candidatus Thorarchaeota archaeon]